MTRKKEPWPYSAGKNATKTEPSSRVRVYDRKGLDGIFMTRAWVKAPSGRPAEVRLPDGVDQEHARLLADFTAAERRKNILAGRTKLGARKAVTLLSLIGQYHSSATSKEWGICHRGDKERGREFWLSVLRGDVDVLELNRELVTTPMVEAMDGGMSPRVAKKRLSYLRAAILWGRDEARLFDTNPLQGLKIQRITKYQPDTMALIFPIEDVRKLLRPHKDVDWRATLAANVAYDTGRRITAILSLRSEDIQTDGERIVLHFRRECDKADRDGFVPISKETAELLADALEQDIVQEYGWIFPEGRLDYDDARDKPWSRDAAIDRLADAEHASGIEHVAGRAYHGIKRIHVTKSMEIAHGDTQLVGDLTGNVSAALLRQTYRFGQGASKARHVDAIREALNEPKTDGNRA